jgi:stage III sporulation protein AG
VVGYVRKGIEWVKRYRYPALILALGLLLLLPLGQQSETTAVAETTEAPFSLEEFTREAENLLSQVQGAGKVELLLTLETQGEATYLQDSSQSLGESSSQTQLETVVVGGEALVVVEQMPTFRGALVLCQGADSPAVTLKVKEALSSLTGLGLDKITVCKMD